MLIVYFLIISILFNAANLYIFIVSFKCQKKKTSLTETEKINVPGFDVFVY